MPDVKSIPFRQANGSGHYESKQLPNNNADFLAILGLPTAVGNVTSASPSSLDGQLAAYWGTSGTVIKASSLIGVVDLVDGKVTTRLSPVGDIVGTLGAQTLNGKTLTNCVVTSPSGLTKADVGLGNVDNTADTAKPVSTATQLALNLKEDKANKGQVNGYAGLDATGKVPTGQLPVTVVGSVRYQGLWNAAVNTPVLPAASAGNMGWYYVVSVAGTSPIDGINEWAVGDWAVSNGTAWNKIDNTDAVSTVSGRTGDIVLAKADVGLSNVDNTSDVTKNNAAATLTNKTINGINNILVVRLDQDVTNSLPVNRLNGGIGAGATAFWCGDGQWKTPSGAGDVAGPADSVDGEIALFSGLTGKLIKRPTPSGTGVASVVNGVYQAPVANVVVGGTSAAGYPTNAIVVPRFLNHPDKLLPVGGSALDDHFDGTVLNAKWTPASSGGNLYPISQVANSQVHLGLYSPSASDNIKYYQQIGTPVPNTNDFTVTVKVDGMVLAKNQINGSAATVDLRLYNATNNLGVALEIIHYTTAAASAGSLFMSVQSGVNFATQAVAHYANRIPKYMRLKWTLASKNVSLQYSNDGSVFQTFWDISSVFTVSILPQSAQLYTSAVNSATTLVHFDWVQFTNP